MRDLENRIAIVTGGASGIGRSIALKLATQGAKISIGDLQGLPREGGKKTEEILKEIGGEAIFTKIDISKGIWINEFKNSSIEYEFFLSSTIVIVSNICGSLITMF